MKMAMIMRTIVNAISHQATLPAPMRMSIVVGVQKGMYEITFTHAASGLYMLTAVLYLFLQVVERA
jgi:hypothetical protein